MLILQLLQPQKAKWIWGVLDELEASGLATLADKGHQGSVLAKIPNRGMNKPESQKEGNPAHARLRPPGERANVQLKTAQDLAYPPKAPLLPLAHPTTRQGHLRPGNSRGIRRLKRLNVASNYWYRQPRGDGELAVLPADTNSLSLVADYPRNLALVLAEMNRFSTPESRLRVRMAIHHGAILPGCFGPVGGAPILVSRLVDAQVLRHTLNRRSDADMALIVSTAVYDEVVRSGFNALDPGRFRRTSIRIKGIRYTGYAHDGDRTTTAPKAAAKPRTRKSVLAAAGALG